MPLPQFGNRPKIFDFVHQTVSRWQVHKTKLEWDKRLFMYNSIHRSMNTAHIWHTKPTKPTIVRNKPGYIRTATGKVALKHQSKTSLVCRKFLEDLLCWVYA